MSKQPSDKVVSLIRADLPKFRRLWGNLAERAGFVQVPLVLIERMPALGLDAVDLAIILQLLRFWWEPERHPFPRKARLAEAIGCSEKTVQRRIQQLERDGLITRVRQIGTSNIYRLDGLVEAVQRLSRETVDARKARESDERARTRRRRVRSA